MNTRTVDPRTIWALLAMEVGLALPIMSMPTQGDRVPGALGPVLLAILLPLGYIAVHQVHDLRDPSWRLLSGIALALATRLVVSVVPEPGLPGLAVWLGRSVVPMAIGIALWWRGSALSVADLTAVDVRTEFSILALGMLAVLTLLRPFMLTDTAYLAGAVGLFALGGLVATALARQDAAEVTSLRSSGMLATLSAALPLAAAVVVVSILRPSLLEAMWTALGQIIVLILTPIGWLLAWLASLFPRGTVPPPQLPPTAPEPPMPDPATLGQMGDRQEWLGWLVLITFLLVGTLGVMLVVRLMLGHWIGAPLKRSERGTGDLSTESSGTPARDARNFFGWLARWLRTRFRRRAGQAAQPTTSAGQTSALDAWAAYRALLEWAAAQGMGRRPAETTGQLKQRLAKHAPETVEAVDLVTTAYEQEHYGAIAQPGDRLRRVRQALLTLVQRP